jgi:acetyl-CoA carboxylase biotin carboxyl carrier protein
MNTNELLHVIQTLKETGFSHIDLMHEGSHILLSNMNVQAHSSESNYYGGGHTTPPFHGNVPTFPHLHGQSHAATQTSHIPMVNSINSVSAANTVVNSIEEAVKVVTEENTITATIQNVVEKEIKGHVIESPIVGTFYSSGNPDADAYVSVGSKVKKGQVLCIIEAMKLMNEIESDVDGEIAEIFVTNEQGVEFGQPLFKIV